MQYNTEHEKPKEKFQSLLEAIPDAAVIVDQGGKIDLVNFQAEKMFGYARSELIGQSIEILIPASQREQHIVERTKYSANPHVRQMGTNLNTCAVRKNREEFPVEISLSPLQTPDGVFVIAAIRDITNRMQIEQEIREVNNKLEQRVLGRTAEINVIINSLKQEIQERTRVEKSLHESEEKFRMVAETIQTAIVLYKANTIIYVNPAAERITGYTLEELVKMNFWDVIHPELRDVVKERGLARQRGEEAPSRYEVKLLTKRGEVRWIDATVSTVKMNNAIVGVVGALDITERKLSEEKIYTLAHAINSIFELVCVTDVDNRLIFVNESFLKVYGYERDEVLGKSPRMLHSSRENPDLWKIICESTLQGGWNGEVINVKKDGTEFPIFLDTSPIIDNQGNKLGLIGIARDISEQKNAEEALRNAENRFQHLFDEFHQLEEVVPVQAGTSLYPPTKKYLHEGGVEAMSDLAGQINGITEKISDSMRQVLSFSSLVAHELRTPLSILRQELEQALNVAIPARELQSIVISTYNEILRLNRITANLLSLSSMLAGTFTTHLRKFDLQKVIKEFYDEAQLLAREKNISMTLRKVPKLSLNGDEDQIRQMLFNIFNNAYKYTPEYGRIHLDCEVIDSEVMIRISDTGSGIVAEDIPRIFKPFFRSTTDKVHTHGIGLGLAFVQWIVEAHRGRVSVESEPGKGTTFIIHLPLIIHNDS